ncbi:sensor kinase SpoOB-type protein [Paenibacillus pabuli]|uniref:Sensor kinase SpoOB-type protein n=2 Tax=Paenibacillus TaxID=44249 RepID=A0A855Y5X4_9BACL|nr:sensor kinase SpoOB-type protein [Paenibacillus pabuli]PXW02904.1 sensor kinase SpoOB-type protein [Paenibacillus taichungensis]RAI96655.1 sensor kinase SpoOB-type protein [Paenibacillus pabuli]
MPEAFCIYRLFDNELAEKTCYTWLRWGLNQPSFVERGEAMKSWKRVPWIAACSLLIPLVFVMLYPVVILIAVYALWSVAVLFVSVNVMKRQAEAERRTIIQSMEKTANASLNHHRHDWMNDLQVLYGYLRLGKLDKSVQCVERIVERVNEESRISRLGIPSLVFYLQSFRTSGVALELHVVVEEELQLSALVSPEDGESLTGAIADAIRAYQYGGGRSSWGEVRKLTLNFGQDHGDVVVRLDGDQTPDPETLRQLNAVLKGKKVRTEQLPSEDTFIQFRMPCGI